MLKEACVSAAVPAGDDLLPLGWVPPLGPCTMLDCAYAWALYNARLCLRLGLVQRSIVPTLGPCTMLDCAYAWALYNARLCLRLGLVQRSIVPALGPCSMLDLACAWALCKLDFLQFGSTEQCCI